jgi:hypothetical protein
VFPVARKLRKYEAFLRRGFDALANAVICVVHIESQAAELFLTCNTSNWHGCLLEFGDQQVPSPRTVATTQGIEKFVADYRSTLRRSV